MGARGRDNQGVVSATPQDHDVVVPAKKRRRLLQYFKLYIFKAYFASRDIYNYVKAVFSSVLHTLITFYYISTIFAAL